MDYPMMIQLLEVSAEFLTPVLVVIVAVTAIDGVVRLIAEWMGGRRQATERRLAAERQHQFQMAALLFQQSVMFMELERARANGSSLHR